MGWSRGHLRGLKKAGLDKQTNLGGRAVWSYTISKMVISSPNLLTYRLYDGNMETLDGKEKPHDY
jgi:hypothetical protein